MPQKGRSDPTSVMGTGKLPLDFSATAASEEMARPPSGAVKGSKSAGADAGHTNCSRKTQSASKPFAVGFWDDIESIICHAASLFTSRSQAEVHPIAVGGARNNEIRLGTIAHARVLHAAPAAGGSVTKKLDIGPSSNELPEATSSTANSLKNTKTPRVPMSQWASTIDHVKQCTATNDFFSSVTGPEPPEEARSTPHLAGASPEIDFGRFRASNGARGRWNDQ